MHAQKQWAGTILALLNPSRKIRVKSQGVLTCKIELFDSVKASNAGKCDSLLRRESIVIEAADILAKLTHNTWCTMEVRLSN